MNVNCVAVPFEYAEIIAEALYKWNGFIVWVNQTPEGMQRGSRGAVCTGLNNCL